MALLAGSGEAAVHVVRFGRLVVLGVARVTLRRQSLELSHCSAFVAGSAVEYGMCPHQRKAVLVLVDLLHRDMPTLHAMTLFAGSAKLALVDVGMAIRTFLAHVGEHRPSVALDASDALVHTSQGEASLIVIELRDITNGLPSGQGVAVLAGNTQRAVWAPCPAIGGALPPSRRQHEQRNDLY